jgi:anti-sigma regulatory factor (Ser/Thr protein kinase)
MTTAFPDSYIGPGARHEALFYESADEFAATVVPFFTPALESEGSALLVTGAENLEAVEGVLGDLPANVFLVDGADWYRRPVGAVGHWVGFVQGQVAKGRSPVRAVAEIPFPQEKGALERWMHYESMMNRVLAPLPLWALCSYNIEVVPPSVIEHVRMSHPTVIERGSASASESYVPPNGAPARSLVLDGQAPAARQPVDIAASSAYVEREARRAGLAEWQVQQLLAAAGEVACNAFVHGSAPVLVTTWAENEIFLCQIEDSGAGIADVAAGYGPPTDDDGWGLWLARRSTDTFELGRGRYGGAVRFGVHRDGQTLSGNRATRL